MKMPSMDEILLKEAKYHEINAQLVEKTNELLKEVKYALNEKENSFSDKSLKSDYKTKCRSVSPDDGFHSRNFHHYHGYSGGSPSPSRSPTRFRDDPSIKTRKNSINFSYGDDIIVKSQSTQNRDTLIKFLQTKVTVLNEEVQKLQSEYRVKVETIKKLQKENKDYADEKIKLKNLIANQKENGKKMDIKLNELTNKLNQSHFENGNLKKELDLLRKQLKQSQLDSNTNELRTQRHLEENEKLKQHLKSNQMELKDLRETNRSQYNDMTIKLRKLEQHKSTLAAAFKKQLILIDNLKRQKRHLEIARMIQFSDAEFAKLLDLKCFL